MLKNLAVSAWLFSLLATCAQGITDAADVDRDAAPVRQVAIVGE